MPATEAAQMGTFELEIELDVPRAAAWAALTDDIDQWWLPDFRATGTKSVVRLDARAGGVLMEVSPDGAELIWYTVQMVQPGSALYMVGHTAADWGGPAISMLKLALAERSGGTTLKISDSVIGAVNPTQLDNLTDGWRNLFGDGLKAHLEGGRDNVSEPAN